MLRCKIVAVPLSLAVWTSFVVIVILWAPLVFLFRLLTFPFDSDRRLVGRLFHSAAALAVRINPFWTWKLVDEGHPAARQPYVFVANHSSFVDAFLLGSLPWEMKFLSKKAILDIPILGWEMRIAGDVPIVRGDKESARQAMARLRRWLDQKVSVVFFPEGTRSEDGTLGPFREGAFRLAIEAGVDIVPIAIAGTRESLPKRSFVFHPMSATLTVLPPVSTNHLTPADAPSLAESVRRTISQAFAARPT